MKLLTLIRKIREFLFPKRKKHFDYSKRYASNWTVISKQAKIATKYHCCLCHKKSCNLETHHSMYKNWLGFPIAGREKLGVNIFPLCPHCHNKAHWKINYLKDRTNPVFGNKNTKQFSQSLRQNYRKLMRKL